MKLSTGRILPDDLSLEPIAPMSSACRLRSGYDSFEEHYGAELTAVERVEVADIMCAQWRAWAGLGE